MYQICGARTSRSISMWLRSCSLDLLQPDLTGVSHQQVARLSQGKDSSYLHKRKANHYDVLKITPKATQAQVKDAYYKLSKMYHPDQYKGDEDPAKKFREIKEAYEILGNFSKRKMYDRGLLGMSVAATPTEAKEYSSRFYESRKRRSEVPSASGKTPIYNFDEWSKVHYQNTRVRKEKSRLRYEEYLKDREEERESNKSQSIIIILLFMMGMILFHITTSVNYDTDKSKN